MRIACFLAAALLAATALAQNSPTPTNAPVVTVVASDAYASETGPNSGTFTIWRSDVSSNSLAVFFSLSGTASNGVDYESVSNNNVIIQPGESSANVVITPINDSIREGNEAVILHLQPSPLLSPVAQYQIGSPAEAWIAISDNDENTLTNRPPTVSITSPANDAVFTTPVDITIFADPRDADGFVAKVEFFQGTNSLGVVTRDPAIDGGPANPWHITWSNVPPGNYSLRAKATDDDGATGSSASVKITVREPESRPTLNVYASDSDAAEPDNGGTFRFLRNGNTNIALSVYYHITGSASNGVDYETLSGVVEMGAGVVAAEVPVKVIDDSIVENTEGVTVSIALQPCLSIYPPPSDCPIIGSASHATVFIRDNDVQPTNARPMVSMTAPANGATFVAPADIALRAWARDPEDGDDITVEFFEGEHRIGTALFVPGACPSTDCPSYALTWSNVPPGRYVLRAKATDHLGAMGWSDPVGITVNDTNKPPETNHPPVVTVRAADAYAVEGPTTYCWTNTWDTNSTPPEGTNTWGIDTNKWHTNYTTVYCRTNNETNVAFFKITRSGSTNQALNVNYSLCGTASNGVDYVELSGTATIAAGRRSAEVAIVPIDDTLAEGIETVVLVLEPQPTAADSLPAYLVGWPNRAGAIIVDNDVPRPPTMRLHDALFHLCAPATNGFTYRLELSTNLVNWIPVCTNTVIDRAVQFVDPDAGSSALRFYRWIPEPDATPE